LKLVNGWFKLGPSKVAPFTGAWIETTPNKPLSKRCSVAPFTGAWIETERGWTRYMLSLGRPLHGGVD